MTNKEVKESIQCNAPKCSLRGPWNVKSILGKTLLSIVILFVALFVYAMVYGFLTGVHSVKNYDHVGLCYADQGPDVVYECTFNVTGETDL